MEWRILQPRYWFMTMKRGSAGMYCTSLGDSICSSSSSMRRNMKMQIWNMKMKMGVIKVMYDGPASTEPLGIERGRGRPPPPPPPPPSAIRPRGPRGLVSRKYRPRPSLFKIPLSIPFHSIPFSNCNSEWIILLSSFIAFKVWNNFSSSSSSSSSSLLCQSDSVALNAHHCWERVSPGRVERWTTTTATTTTRDVISMSAAGQKKTSGTDFGCFCCCCCLVLFCVMDTSVGEIPKEATEATSGRKGRRAHHLRCRDATPPTSNSRQ